MKFAINNNDFKYLLENWIFILSNIRFLQQNQERHFANQPGLGFEPPPSLITLRPELPISQVKRATK